MTTSASHTLTFSRLRANFTVDKELIGKQDPYIIFNSGSAKVQTKAIKGVGTGTAEWKESYSLENFSPSSSSVIEVTVYNHNTLLPDSVIGAGKIDLASQGESSLSGSGDPVSVVLVDKKGQEVGSLSFVTHGGGYTGRGGRTGTHTGTGVGTGVGSGTRTGVGSGTHTGVGSGTHTGVGSGTHTGVGSGTHTGVGSGTHTGVGSGTHTGVGSGTHSGVGSGTHSGVGSGTHSGVGSGTHTGTGVGSGTGTGAGSVVGRGIGSDQRTAQAASDKAAAVGHKTTVEGERGVGVGHPVGTGTGSGVGTGHHHTGTGSGVGTGTGHHHHTDTERGVGTGHHHHTGTGAGVTGTSVTDANRAAYGTKEGEVIDRKYYVGTESRPQDQALVEQYREHNPYAKDYETTVQHTGRERLVGSQIEALGTRERVIGQDHHVQSHPHQEIARHLPTGALNERPGGEGWVQTKPGPVCDTNTFSITGDRTVDKERVTDLRENREFEKEFEVKTRLVGERELNRGTDAEILNRERVLVDEKNKVACEGHPTVPAGGATLAGQRGTGVGTGTHTGVGSGTHTGVGSGTHTGVGSGTHTGVGSGTHTGVGSGTHTGVGSGYGTSGVGTGSGSHTGVGSGTHTGVGSGYGTSGVGTGTGQRSTMGEKAAGFIPGSEESRDKKQGYQPGQGPTGTPGNATAGEKAASFIPGSEENREKKTAQYN